jgi:hypothetical protein
MVYWIRGFLACAAVIYSAEVWGQYLNEKLLRGGTASKDKK